MLKTEAAAFFEQNNIEYRFNAPMSEYTTFKIGGPVDCICYPEDTVQLKSILKLCSDTETPYFVLGNGSNLLVSDLGIDGIAISLRNFCDISCPSALEIECGAGVRLSKLCSFAMEQSLGCLEFAWGIPGTVGGAVYMNAGAYGSEMSAVIKECTYISPDGKVVQADVSALDFGYRHSAFSDTDNIILSARFMLAPCATDTIRDNMEELMQRRRDKQPLEYPSAGSTFKRPVGGYAAALIDECGLKGETVGNAQVSEKHAGFIINKEAANSQDIRSLIGLVKSTVYEKFGVELEPEYVFWSDKEA